MNTTTQPGPLEVRLSDQLGLVPGLVPELREAASYRRLQCVQVHHSLLSNAADEIERLRADARMLRELLRNAQTAICSREHDGWRGGTTCGQAAEALHKTRYLKA